MTYRPSNTGELAQLVRECRDRATPLRIAGSGSWLDAGGPVRSGATRLDTLGLAGIVEYVPGDLTVTARAATTLEELDAVTTPHGQWCPLLPWGDDRATLGAVFATGIAGPFQRALGRPRDLALGLEFVDGTGATVRAGGRVVKNVAGFDLTRLLVGSWGTLGVITEVSVRLRARPAVDESWALTSDSGAWERLAAFENGPFAPLALVRVPEAERAPLGLDSSCTALARIGGNASFVTASRGALRALGDAEPCDPAVWSRYRAVRKEGASAEFANALADPISRRIKLSFDPARILNPGIFGEETS